MAEDRKFKFENGQFVNRVSGEPIPDDEPVILFRARDWHSLDVLNFYRQIVADPHHIQAIEDRISEFEAFAEAHPERMKEPGITRHIVLNASGMSPGTAKTAQQAEGEAGQPDPKGDALTQSEES